jgi:hypothetical protein
MTTARLGHGEVAIAFVVSDRLRVPGTIRRSETDCRARSWAAVIFDESLRPVCAAATIPHSDDGAPFEAPQGSSSIDN